MFTITKQFEFEASHRLRGLPNGHQCGRHHGHSYVVEVELSSDDVDELGFVQDFGELKPIKLFIDQYLDHRHLNDDEVVYALQLGDAAFSWNPTAENLARALFNLFRFQFQSITAVRVSETKKTWATYRPVVKIDFTPLPND